MGTFVAADASSTTTSTNTLTGVTWPSHTGDDLALLAHASDQTQSLTIDADFATVKNVVDGSLRAYLGKREPSAMTGSESGDVTITSTPGGNRQAGALAVYRGYTAVTNAQELAETGTGTSHASPPITPSSANSGIVYVYLERTSNSTTTLTPPGGLTKRGEFGTSGTGGTYVCIADQLGGHTPGVAFNPGSWTSAVSSGVVVVLAVELTPASTSLTLGLATETDTALGLSRSKVRTLGTTTETDIALPLTRVKTRTLGLATSTETALGITRTKVYTLGLAVETDTALGLAVAKTLPLGLATEVDEAFALAPPIFVQPATALIVGAITGPHRAGPAVTGPAVARSVSDPAATVRVVTGPSTARTVTGPGV